MAFTISVALFPPLPRRLLEHVTVAKMAFDRINGKRGQCQLQIYQMRKLLPNIQKAFLCLGLRIIAGEGGTFSHIAAACVTSWKVIPKTDLKFVAINSLLPAV